MVKLGSLDLLEDIDHYRRLFTSVPFWEAYVKEVCRRHGLRPDTPVRAGVPGTCPVFIAGERWLIKFFGRLFGGGNSFQAEREAGGLMRLAPAIPVAPIIAQGELGGDSWPWPYIVYLYLPGASLEEMAGQISEEDWQAIACEMGVTLRRLHALPLTGSAVFPPNLDAYCALLAAQRAACTANHYAWGSLPSHLVDQIEGFLPPLDDLVDRTCPAHLIHADLTRDHLLGRIVEGRWQTLGLIDFGDAMTGDLSYELAALQLDMFRGDRRLLNIFLDAYGLDVVQRSGLARRAMATALLHQFDVFCLLPRKLLHMQTLEELADVLWGS
jgi:hypothetical protein